MPGGSGTLPAVGGITILSKVTTTVGSGTSTDIIGRPTDAAGEAGVSVGVLEHLLVDDELITRPRKSMSSTFGRAGHVGISSGERLIE
jgi:hypothetical protein